MTAADQPGVPSNQILCGDARQVLPRLPAASVDCVITSPPYFRLRDYGHRLQLGLEPDIDRWVVAIREVCRQLARVLKPSGVLWLNVGDSYSAHPREGAAPKSLLLGPQRLALALLADGWLLRNQVVWFKRNNLPASVTDRLSGRYELVLLLVRSPHYFFDLDAIREPHAGQTSRTAGRSRRPVVVDGRALETYRGLNRLSLEGRAGHPLGKNPGDVWSLASGHYQARHVATFPPALVERPLLATCPARVCVQCGHAWKRTPVDRSVAQPQPGSLVPDCDCAASTRPGLVLDPFIGSGTVALVAEKHHRAWLGIELNPVYVALANQRIAAARNRQRDRGIGTGGEAPAA